MLLEIVFNSVGRRERVEPASSPPRGRALCALCEGGGPFSRGGGGSLACSCFCWERPGRASQLLGGALSFPRAVGGCEHSVPKSICGEARSAVWEGKSLKLPRRLMSKIRETGVKPACAGFRWDLLQQGQVEQGTQGGSLGSGIWPGVRDSGLHGCDGAGVGAVELEPLGSEQHLGWVSAHVTGFRGAPRLPGNPATALSSQAPPPAAGFQALRPCERRPAPALVPRCSGGLCARRLVRFAVTTPLRRLSKFSIKHFVVNFVTSK